MKSLLLKYTHSMSGNGERVISSGCGCRAVRGEAGKWRRHANTSRRASKGQEHINQYWRMSEDVTADAAHRTGRRGQIFLSAAAAAAARPETDGDAPLQRKRADGPSCVAPPPSLLTPGAGRCPVWRSHCQCRGARCSRRCSGHPLRPSQGSADSAAAAAAERRGRGRVNADATTAATRRNNRSGAPGTAPAPSGRRWR
jgi:hypothetical protein